MKFLNSKSLKQEIDKKLGLNLKCKDYKRDEINYTDHLNEHQRIKTCLEVKHRTAVEWPIYY